MKLDSFPVRYVHRFQTEWWEEPDLPVRKVFLNNKKRNMSPEEVATYKHSSKNAHVARFAIPTKWIPYAKIGGINGGYIVPLYSMKEIGVRYGLTHNSQLYWKKYIMPPPIEIVRRRSVQAHHWSRFTLVALDVVLKDLHKRGYSQFTRYMDDHIRLFHKGGEYLARRYEQEYEDSITDGDRFRVTWL